jgi:hypothetical protein
MSSKRSDQLSYTFIRQVKIIISHFFPFENCLKAIFLILWIFSAIPAEKGGAYLLICTFSAVFL